MNILIADDNRMLIDGLNRLLPTYGLHVVAIAQNGLEAVRKFKSHRENIDLVLLDNNMPFLSGLEAAHQIHTLNSEILIFMLSGNPPESHEWKTAGIQAVIRKPFNSETLIEQIHQNLAERKQLQNSEARS